MRARAAMVLATLAAGALAASAAAQWGRQPEVSYTNIPYNGRFTFARIRFEPSQWGVSRRQPWGLDLKWNHDYPRADQRLEEILELVTGAIPNTQGSVIVGLDDPELFRYPWAYLCEVGFLQLSDLEAENLRNYLLKGGFVVVDDFDGYHWFNFLDQMEKVMPEGRFIEIHESHPVFHAFFEIEDLQFGVTSGAFFGYGWPRYFGLFEDNDPDKRLMMIANYNNDIGEYWEWADSEFIPIDLTNDAYKLGINYIIYSMIH